MKRIFVLWLLFVLLPCCVLAGADAAEMMTEASVLRPSSMETVPPEAARYPCTAVAAGQYYGETVPLFEAPEETSAVLMTYYRGAQLTVLREAKPGFVQVQSGSKEAGLLGYMRRSDLAFGSNALREIQPEYVMIRLNRDTPVYAYCDAFSERIGTCDTEHEYYTIGKNDGMWVQLHWPVGSDLEGEDGSWKYIRAEEGFSGGFVQLETGLARGYSYKATRWEVEPVPGEMTREQAIERVIWWMINANGDIPDKLRDEAVLRRLPFEAVWEYSPENVGYIPLSITVSYTCDAYSISVGLLPDGSIRYGRYEEAAEGS